MATNASALKRILLAGLLAAGALVSCQKIEQRLDDLEDRVSNLETVSDYLQKAIRENKMVREVRESDDAYVLTFTDGTSLTIDRSGAEVSEVRVNRDSVVVTMTDGTVYTLSLLYVGPTGIVLASARPVKLGFGASAVLPFRVNPAGAVIDLQEVALVTDCGYFALEEVRHSESGGVYEAVLRDLSRCTDYDADACLSVGGIYSDAFRVASNSIFGLNTGLPVVVLDTPGSAPIVSKEDWMDGAAVTIYNPDGSIDFEGGLSVKGRGNSTWTQFPKKPYAMKLDSKGEILGMPKHKRWCLLANWMDRTLIRNDVAFEISRRTGLAWTPSGKFVELVLNGEHMGNYYLCEQIKVDKNRVNLSDEGFIMECDLWYDEQFKFMSPVHNVPWQFKDPDEVIQEQFDSMYGYVAAFESALFDAESFAARAYVSYVDPGSFADWWLVNELAQNSEINQPKSAYIHREKDGKLVAGPVWDFDWGTFIPKDRYNYVAMGPKYYVNQMFQDREFRRLIKERWAQYKAALATIPQYIDSIAATLTESDRLNISLWPISRTTNQDESLSYEAAVARLKAAYEGKYEWLDNNINTF